MLIIRARSWVPILACMLCSRSFLECRRGEIVFRVAMKEVSEIGTALVSKQVRQCLDLEIMILSENELCEFHSDLLAEFSHRHPIPRAKLALQHSHGCAEPFGKHRQA